MTKAKRGTRGENFLQLKDGSSAKPRKGFKHFKKNKTKTKSAHIYQLRSGATTTRCGGRKLQESYEYINNAPKASLPTKQVMIWDSLTIIHREREKETEKMYTTVGIKTLLLNARGAQKAAGFTDGQSHEKFISRPQRVDLRHMLITCTQ